jgi:hypothetical protein
MVGNPVGLTLNSLEEVTQEMWRDVFDADEFEATFNGWAMSHGVSTEERQRIGMEIAEDFFAENTEENLSSYLAAV